MKHKILNLNSFFILTTLGMIFYNGEAFAELRCPNGIKVAQPIGWTKGNQEFPKLFFTADELGLGVACARNDLKNELIRTANSFYRLNIGKASRIEVEKIGIDAEAFYINAIGDGYFPTNSLSQRTNPRFPGDARLAQKLASAAFFETPTTAGLYRDFAKTVILHWANHTFKEIDMPRARAVAATSSEQGLILGSNMSAFAGTYDLLAASGSFSDAAERATVEQWFSRMLELIKLSNDAWMANCRNGVPFSYDGMSCERAMGDNHVTVGSAAAYVLAVMTENKPAMNQAIRTGVIGGWGYFDRLGTIIYNLGDKKASPDRFATVHTGEIYDRWRGHYVERVRGLQMHRSFAYPFLSLSYLTVHALAAKRQGLDLMVPVQKKNGMSIGLDKAFLFYAEFLKNYNPGALINPSSPKTRMSSELNYTSLLLTYCVNGQYPIATDQKCAKHVASGALKPGVTDQAYTSAYFHIIYAGAYALANKVAGTPYAAIIKSVISPEKMKFVDNSFSPHIIPFEPALLVDAETVRQQRRD